MSRTKHTRCLFLLACLTAFGCDGGGNVTPSAPNPALQETFGGSIAVFGEIEVNDGIAMANPVTLPTPSSGDDYVGFQVNGTIETSKDGVDTFAFIADRKRLYAIELCTFPCDYPSPGTSMRLSVGYFQLMDQSGEVVLVSNDQTGRIGNFREIDIDAGVLYYVSIVAEDTRGVIQPYSLVAAESPF